MSKKVYFIVLNLNDIFHFFKYDKSNERFRIFKNKFDMFKFINERFYNWVIYDFDKNNDLKLLRHSLKRVLEYWRKYNVKSAMFTNSFASIITITKTITIVIITNISNSISDIIIIKSFIERPKQFIKRITELRDTRNKKDAKNDYEKSIS